MNETTNDPGNLCIYCDQEIPLEKATEVPSPSDDAAWERLAEDHAPGCEWIATRAHRLGDGPPPEEEVRYWPTEEQARRLIAGCMDED
jgi:hypothetical protein